MDDKELQEITQSIIHIRKQTDDLVNQDKELLSQQKILTEELTKFLEIANSRILALEQQVRFLSGKN